MALKYYYKNQAEQFSFIRVPKILVTDNMFKSLSIEAKLLYGMLLERMSDSEKARWLDEKNRVYIIYPLLNIQQDFNISKAQAIEFLNELENIGLIERRIRGQGVPSHIYVKIFIVESEEYMPARM